MSPKTRAEKFNLTVEFCCYYLLFNMKLADPLGFT